MATSTQTVIEVEAPSPHSTLDITTRLLNGTLHAGYPPFEQFATIDGLLKAHAAQPDEAKVPLICYPVRGAADFEQHTAGDLDRYTDIAVRYYTGNGLPPADPSLEQAPVVALLVGSSFEVILTMFALNRLGYANARTSSLQSTMSGPYERSVKSAPVVPASQYFNGKTGSIVNLTRHDSFAPTWIPHERDGKLRGFFTLLAVPAIPNQFFSPISKPWPTGQPGWKSFGLRFFTTSPLFHSFALMELGRAFYTRATAFFGNHALPTTFQNLHDALEVAQPEQFSAVPYVIKLLAERPEGVKALARPKIVLFGGSSCPDDLGDRLVAQGVNLVANYGATETGQIMTSFRPPGDNEWQYMRLHRPVADFTLMDEISPGVFECVALDGLPSKGPSNSKPPFSAKNPENSFRTADLFTRHPDPSKGNYYKYLSRLDDRITLVNGEKVLPIPIEGRIREESLVRECVVFGYQKTVPGALIFRASEKSAELSDEEFIEAIWPAVEAANSRAETFSRIPRELILVMGAHVSYAATDKGTFIRAKVYQQFAKEIEAAYANYGGGSKRGELALDLPDLEDWLLARFRDDLEVPLSDADADIFAAGVDSLQTTQIWRFIVRDLDLSDKANTLSQNIVFEKGTVRALAKHLYHMRTGRGTLREDEIQTMRDLIEKYSNFTQHHPTLQREPDSQVVIVTGATGNMGGFLIAELVKRPDVSEVWALVRAPGQAAAGARLYQALADRKISLTVDEAAKLRAVPSDLSQADLGLDNHVIEHLLSSLTCIIHSAWAVNFNLGSGPLFLCSSVSTASNTPKPAVIRETAIENLHYAQATGYGRSKLVTELITRNAMRQTGMHARVLRIGQLSGDTAHTQWNDTEAVALMFRSVLTTGTLPALDESPSWLPVDECARAVAHLAMMQSTTCIANADLVYNLVNPATFSWKDELLPTLKTNSLLPPFEVVSPQEWLRRLESSEQDPKKNPSIKLLDFWRVKYRKKTEFSASNHESLQRQDGLQFETGRTVQDCPSLSKVKNPVNAGLMQRYIQTWMQRWTR
ncbi:hypothetical protein POX_b02382 [Penicillium oxalicum]|uniref:hypothetical protein n=1 Tax=Penicillium oxalicum TaxID=69781 RepID=UPI0020B8359F|nr:hypothetical protein POX_b02382 [Penicillium oxalicum]KAI2792345.1 hypothetical protein POX_b02382 [Penicillium oxalicum]